MKPQKHYLIDFLPLLLTKKVEKLNQKDIADEDLSFYNDQIRFIEGEKNNHKYNDKYLSAIIQRIIELYPNEIEK